MTKLKQVCNHPAHFLRDGSRLAGRSGKLERLEEILDEVLADGEKALLFTQYAEFGALLRGHLAGRFGREVLFLHGGVPKPARDAMVARFQADDAGSPPLFVLSLKAGGTGLTLTAANHVVHVDRWWNPAVEDQATDRAFRIGQTPRRAGPQVRLRRHGRGEDRRDDRDKRGLAAKIVGTGEQWLTELSTGQLRGAVRARGRGGGRMSRPWSGLTSGTRRRGRARSRTGSRRAAAAGAIGDVVVVAAVPRRARVVRHGQPADPGPQLRARGAGHLARTCCRARCARGCRDRGLARTGSRSAWPRFRELVWAKAEIALSEQALPSAKLLAGEMPPEIEELFAAAGAPLFPRTVASSTMRAAARTGRCRASTSRRPSTCWPRPSTTTRS